MPKSRPPYPEEFRREAVQLVRSGRTFADVAESLGVTEPSLRTWVKRDQSIGENVMTGFAAMSARSSLGCGARKPA